MRRHTTKANALAELMRIHGTCEKVSQLMRLSPSLIASSAREGEWAGVYEAFAQKLVEEANRKEGRVTKETAMIIVVQPSAIDYVRLFLRNTDGVAVRWVMGEWHEPLCSVEDRFVKLEGN